MKMNDTHSAIGNLFSQKKIEISSKKQSNFCLQKIQLTEVVSSIKKNTTLYAKNITEQEFTYLLEFEESVFHYYEKPFILNLTKRNQVQSFIPSFVVEDWDGNKTLIEIIESNIPNLVSDHKEYISDFCVKNMFDYRIVSKEEISSNQLFNATFLLSYRNPKFGFNTNDPQIVLNMLKKFGQITVQQLLDCAVQDETSRLTLLYVIWHMVSNHQICFDQENKLGMDTKLWLHNL